MLSASLAFVPRSPHMTPSRLRAGAAVATIAVLAALAGCSAPGGAGLGGHPATDAKGGGGSGGGGSTATSTPKAGSGGSGGVDVSKLDPCVLFPQAAAEALVAAKLSEPTDEKDQSQPSCTYNPDPNGGDTAQATLSLGPGAENYYTIDHNQGHAFTDVPGLGDEAHLEPQPIFWKSHGVWAEINMLRLVDDDHQFDQPLIDAAKAVDALLG
jgi:hypothetical protein